MKLDFNPCYECPDRHYKCHSECDKYIEAKRRHAEIKQKMEAGKEYMGYVSRVAHEKRERFRKLRK